MIAPLSEPPAPPPPPSDTRPIRQRRPFFIGGELGWNGLAGLGLNFSYHPIPYLAIDTGLGLSVAGWRVGARVRGNLLTGEWTPVLGAGVTYSAGSGGNEVPVQSTDEEAKIEVFGSPYLQLVGGVNYTGDEGFVFTATTGDWTGAVQAAELSAADGATGDRLGYSVAVSGDALVAGAPDRAVGGNNEQGSAYLFTAASGDWSDAAQAAEFVASDGAAGDGLGRSVGTAAGAIVASAPDRTIGGNSQQGAAYVFQETAGVWSQVAKLVADDGEANNYFGQAAAIAGDNIVVGAYGASVGGNALQGAAYVYTNVGGTWTFATPGRTRRSRACATRRSGSTREGGPRWRHHGRSRRSEGGAPAASSGS